MQRTLLLLIGVVVLLFCGMLLLRERCSVSAVRKQQYERIETHMTEKEVLAILGEPTGRRVAHGGWYLWWEFEKDGSILVMILEDEARVMYKAIHEPLSLWGRVKQALNFGEDERLGQTFAF
jgi:hypothetical protein